MEAAVERLELRGYTYRFMESEPRVLSCDRCGALIAYNGVDVHDHFHALLNVVLNAKLLL